MTSQKQIEANKLNALKSTGPKTPEGKVIVSKNATTHGLRAQHTVIDSESQTEFNEFYNELIQYLAPVYNRSTRVPQDTTGYRFS